MHQLNINSNAVESHQILGGGNRVVYDDVIWYGGIIWYGVAVLYGMV